MAKLIKIVVLFLLISISANAQIESFGEIQKNLRAGDATELSKSFNNTVECEILGTENMYSRSQAVLIFKNFFSQYKPKTFVIQQTKSQRNGSLYVIGAYASQGGDVFRVIIYAKDIRGTVLVYQIKIEKC